MGKLTRSIQRNFLRATSDVTCNAAAGGAQGILMHEENKCLIVGPTEDVKKIQGLDLAIGKLASPFNGHCAVPEKQLGLIAEHIKDVSDSLTRVQSFKLILPKNNDLVDELAKFLSGDFAEKAATKQRVYTLNYVNNYKTVLKNTQRIATIHTNSKSP